MVMQVVPGEMFVTVGCREDTVFGFSTNGLVAPGCTTGFPP